MVLVVMFCVGLDGFGYVFEFVDCEGDVGVGVVDVFVELLV